MITHIENKINTFDEVLHDPNLSHIHEAIHYIQNTTFSKIFPKKHEMGLMNFVTEKTINLFEADPHLPIKKVIMTIFDKIEDTDISATLMLKLTKRIILEWKTLSLTLNGNDNKSITI